MTLREEIRNLVSGADTHYEPYLTNTAERLADLFERWALEMTAPTEKLMYSAQDDPRMVDMAVRMEIQDRIKASVKGIADAEEANER